MQIKEINVSAYISSYYEFTKKNFVITFSALKEIRESPDAFQKICLIALSVIRAINFYCNTNYLPRFISVLDTAPAFDFYGFYKLPNYFLHPYSAERLDEYDLLNQLEPILCHNMHLGVADDQGVLRDPMVEEFVKERLTFFLDKMHNKNLNFASEEKVRIVLQNLFKNSLEINPKEDFDSQNIDFHALSVKLKPISWLETSSIYALACADVVCVPDFLQTWGLINLAPAATAIGRIPLFYWVSNQAIGDCVWGALLSGFALQFINAAQRLRKENLSLNEAREVKWTMIASLAESVYCLSNLLKIDAASVNFLALIAKSAGLIAFFLTTKPIFFNDENDLLANEKV